jgi:hypothetical protein
VKKVEEGWERERVVLLDALVWLSRTPFYTLSGQWKVYFLAGYKASLFVCCVRDSVRGEISIGKIELGCVQIL